MTFSLSQRSLKTLVGVHPDLVRVIHRAIKITEVDFLVGCGVRTLATQRKYVREGKSKTMNSRHLLNNGYSHAVDLWMWKDGGISWDTSGAEDRYTISNKDDYENYQEIGTSVIAAANELGIPIRWGADWDGDGQHTDHSFIDWVHQELPEFHYPKK
jgi:peptidoglycan L-alanyl-D-glutamate endopeptidase CwlK